MHIWTVYYLYSVISRNEVFDSHNLVGGERAEDVRKSKGFWVALSVEVVAEKFLHSVYSLVKVGFFVNV